VLTLNLAETLAFRQSPRRKSATSRQPHQEDQREEEDSNDPIEDTTLSPNPNHMSLIQGGDQQWWVQFLWAVYYAAGTLVYSSIMAVTVVVLVVWVLASCVAAAASKMLAFRLCRNWV
jgi:hypothetical protein